VDDETAIGQQRTRMQAGQNRLKAHRLRVGLTQAEVAEALANLAWERDGERLPVDANQVSKWERGLKRPRKFYRRLFCALYGASEEDLGLRPPPGVRIPHEEDADGSSLRGAGLIGAPPAPVGGGWHPVGGEGFNGSLDDLVAASTAEATALVSGAARAGYDQSTLIGQAYVEAADLATRYLTSPPAPMLVEAHECRRHVLMMFHDRVAPKQSRDLYVVAALLSGINAYACLDLGHPDAAMTQADAGHVCAAFAGHDGLQAWMYGTQSLIARFQGEYAQALDLAREGLRYAATGTALDRLRCGEAQSLACLGDRAAARHALDLADQARERITIPDVAGGIFAFTEAKHAYYSGSALIWLPQPEEARVAEEQSARAIELFEAGPPEERNLADEALAHVYLGTARVTLGDLDGVLEAIRPVLDIPPGRRISWQRKRLARLYAMLDEHRFQRSPLATALKEEISAF
jgi:transcriptional regulator with XRE-family HTH domain/tetratricopeptide (TPR) repeat protein